jgi:hypothetical protein
MPRLKTTETNTLDEAFSSFQGAGYVLDFSDRTFAAYFDEEFGIDIDDQRYQINGHPKASGSGLGSRAAASRHILEAAAVFAFHHFRRRLKKNASPMASPSWLAI